jgi:hypothetical protein
MRRISLAEAGRDLHTDAAPRRQVTGRSAANRSTEPKEEISMGALILRIRTQVELRAILVRLPTLRPHLAASRAEHLANDVARFA